MDRSTGESTMKLLRKVRPVVIVGRDITSDAQAFDPIIDTNGRVLVNMGPTAGTLLPGAYGTLFDSGNVAGNVPTTVALPALQELELTGMGITYNCDATVATRTIRMEFSRPWVAIATGVTNAQAYTSNTLTLTASEDGGIHALPNGLEVVNDNSAFTTTVGRTPFPIIVNSAVVIAPIIGAGVAGDTYRFGLYGRRVA